jgi:acyl carrier protein
MSDAALLARVQALVSLTAGAARTPANAGPDTPLARGGFWLDSVDLVEVVVACEQEFDVTFEGETDLTPESLDTIRTLARLIRSKQAA